MSDTENSMLTKIMAHIRTAASLGQSRIELNYSVGADVISELKEVGISARVVHDHDCWGRSEGSRTIIDIT